MTLKTKRVILNGTSVICILTFILMLITVSMFAELQNERFIILLTKSLFLLIGSILLHIYFRKSLPSEVIFYSIYICSLSMLCLRGLTDFLLERTLFSILATGRTAYFLKYMSLFSLLGTSLFSFSIKKQKIGSWLLISLLTSLVISSILHFNTGIIERNYLPRVIYKYEEIFITISITIITLLTYLKSGFDAKNRDFFYLSWATLLLSIAIISTFILSGIFMGILMIISFIGGTIIYLRSIHYITLWS